MPQLSPYGREVLLGVAQRSGFSLDAVISMFDSVWQGRGSMAQFSHPEFGGSGQWMSGGMTMLSDMFNNQLKYRVEGLCAELAGLTNQANLMAQPNPLLAPAGPDWWGPDLRWPNSTGSQNNVRYAYFAQACRLATEVNGTVVIYNTLDHQIGGFSQQQSGGASFGFSSQYGTVDVSSLPVVSVNGVAPQIPPPPAPQFEPANTYAPAQAAPTYAPVPAPAWAAQGNSPDGDIFATIERLSSLHQRGFLTDAEYQTKKAELLARL